MKICIKCNNKYKLESNSQKQCTKCKNKQVLCACACGDYAKPGRKFIRGHNMRGREVSQSTREKCRKNGLGKKASEDTKNKLRKASLGNQRAKGHTKTPKGIEKIRQVNSRENLSDERINQLKRQAYEKLQDPNSNFGWPNGESYPEKYFREFLEAWGSIKDVDFFQEYQVGRYSLDFVFIDDPEKMRYIEIDGSQHDTPKAIEHDRTRDKYLQSQGLTGMRIPARELKEFLRPLWPKIGDDLETKLKETYLSKENDIHINFPQIKEKIDNE